MANDRCWLVCKVCDDRVLLAKHFGEDWGATPTGATHTPISAGERMERFVEKHGQLMHGFEERKDDRQPFRLEYEVTKWEPHGNAGPNRD